MLNIAIRLFAHVALVAWALAIGLAQYWLYGMDKALPHVLLFGLAAWIVKPDSEAVARYTIWLDERLAEHQATVKT